jgi:PAS domain S-box-containing protein
MLTMKQPQINRDEIDERFRLLADTAPVMLWMSGPDKLCTYFNRRWLEFTGRPIEAELGLGWIEMVHADQVKQCVDTYERAFDRRQPFTVEYQLRRFDGEYRWVLDNGAPRFGPDGSFAGYIGSAVDVTSSKLAEEALAHLSQKLMEAHEAERARIARDLHDDFGQRMAVLTMGLESVSRVIARAMPDTAGQIRGLYGHALSLATDLQALSHRLHSPRLDYLGLVEASEGLCREVTEQHRVDVVFTASGIPQDVPKDVTLCMFRVLQEAVTNAVKHAGVQRVRVAFTGSAHGIGLEVADAGVGFDPETAMRGRGLGLLSMRERLHLVKGEIEIDSRPNAGTTIRARVPVSSLSSV